MSPRYLTVPDVAAKLGMAVQTVYNDVNPSRRPTPKGRGPLLFKEHELDAMLEQIRVVQA